MGLKNHLSKKEEAELEDFVQNSLNAYMFLPHPCQPSMFELFQDFDGSSFETNDRWQCTLQVTRTSTSCATSANEHETLGQSLRALARATGLTQLDPSAATRPAAAQA